MMISTSVVVEDEEEEESLVLPPGFRFHPTDEEIITHYLSPKLLSHGAFSARAMGDVDLNKSEPWDLPRKAKMGEGEWYFFCQRDRKYPTGTRTNRATASGYWKATGKDKEIHSGGRGSILVGMKKTLVFYTGRAPKGEKTNWVMHEFRLESLNYLPKSSMDEWVVCRVFHKNTVIIPRRSPMHGNGFLLDSPALPPLIDTASFPDSGVFDDSFATESYLESSVFDGGWLPSPADAIRRHCKAEQFSNTSMMSGEETGVSNAEISSVVSINHEIGSRASYDQDLVASRMTASGRSMLGFPRM